MRVLGSLGGGVQWFACFATAAATGATASMCVLGIICVRRRIISITTGNMRVLGSLGGGSRMIVIIVSIFTTVSDVTFTLAWLAWMMDLAALGWRWTSIGSCSIGSGSITIMASLATLRSLAWLGSLTWLGRIVDTINVAIGIILARALGALAVLAWLTSTRIAWSRCNWDCDSQFLSNSYGLFWNKR